MVGSAVARIFRFVNSLEAYLDPSRSATNEPTNSAARLFVRIIRRILRLGRNVLKYLAGRKVTTMIRLSVHRDVAIHLPPRVEIRPSARGLNIVGSFNAESGLGEWTRSSIRAARSAMIGINLIQCNVREFARTNDNIGLESESDSLFDVSLFHFNPLQIYANIDELAPHFDSGYNIGCWIWEVTEIPAEWKPLFDLFNEIWTPTEFCCQAIQSTTSIPVTRIPISVAPEVPSGYDRKRLGLPETGFIFVTVADFYSCAERKNPLGVLEAYKMAFGSRSDLYLVVKISNASHRPDIMKIIQEHLDRDDSIIPFLDYLDRPVLNALIASCNCLVSLHRAEGFGLPIAEAMFMGKPVIATGWSGNMDFMNEHNSLPVNYQVVEICEDNPDIPYKNGWHWAEPDLTHASELMRLVVNAPDLTDRIGGQAMNDIRDQLSPEAVGALMKRRLAELRQI